MISISLHRAERRQRLVEFFRVADHQHGQLIAVQIFCGDAIYVGGRDFLDLRLEYLSSQSGGYP